MGNNPKLKEHSLRILSQSKSREKSLYPLPDEGILSKFFYASLDVEKRLGTFIYLHPPATAKVTLNYKHFGGIQEYRVSVPWHTFGAKVEFEAGIILMSTFMHFFNEEPKDMKAVCCKAIVPNMYPSGKICYGKARPWRKSRIDRYLRGLHRDYWSGRFTCELPSGNVPGKILEKAVEIDSTFDALTDQFQIKRTRATMMAWEDFTKRGEVIDWREMANSYSQPMNLERMLSTV